MNYRHNYRHNYRQNNNEPKSRKKPGKRYMLSVVVIFVSGFLCRQQFSLSAYLSRLQTRLQIGVLRYWSTFSLVSSLVSSFVSPRSGASATLPDIPITFHQHCLTTRPCIRNCPSAWCSWAVFLGLLALITLLFVDVSFPLR